MAKIMKPEDAISLISALDNEFVVDDGYYGVGGARMFFDRAYFVGNNVPVILHLSFEGVVAVGRVVDDEGEKMDHARVKRLAEAMDFAEALNNRCIHIWPKNEQVFEDAAHMMACNTPAKITDDANAITAMFNNGAFDQILTWVDEHIQENEDYFVTELSEAVGMAENSEQFSYIGPPVSDMEISDAEKSIGVQFPEELRKMYRMFDGGEFCGGYLDVWSLEGMKALCKLSMAKHRVPENYLPFADVGFPDAVAAINLDAPHDVWTFHTNETDKDYEACTIASFVKSMIDYSEGYYPEFKEDDD